MRTSSAPSRNLRETAAAFTNWGRLPTIVAINTASFEPGRIYPVGACSGCWAKPGEASPISRGTSRTAPKVTSARVLRTERPQLLLDLPPECLSGFACALAGCGRQPVLLDCRDRLDLPGRRSDERLGGIADVGQSGRPLLDVRHAQHAVTRDRRQDVLAERRRA